MKARLAIDQGTTGTKTFVADTGGRIRELGRHKHRQFYPHPGWVEHDAAELLETVARFCAPADAEATIGIANQGQTVVAWDARTKQPLYIMRSFGRTRGHGMPSRGCVRMASSN